MQRLTFYMYEDGSDYILTNDSLPNPYEVDIDENTVIGVDFQAYDLKNPGKRLRNISNDFSIPATDKNLAFFAFPNNINIKIETAPDRSIYNPVLATYQLDNTIIFYKSSIRIDSISNKRINISIISNDQKNKGLNILKSLYWDKSSNANNSLAALTFAYLKATFYNDLPTVDDPYTGTFTQFHDNHIEGNVDIALGDFVSNFNPIELNFSEEIYASRGGGNFTVQGNADGDIIITTPSVYNDTVLTFYYDRLEDKNNRGYGAHFALPINYILGAIHWYYNTYLTNVDDNYQAVSFDFSEFLGDTSTTFLGKYIFCPSLIVTKLSTITPGDIMRDDICEWAFTFKSDLDATGYQFAGDPSITDKPDKTAYDFLMQICLKYNILLTETFTSENKAVIKLYDFNKINSFQNTNIVDWSKNFKGIKSFKPSITEFTKNDLIYKKVFDGGFKQIGGLSLYSNNENLTKEGTVLEVDGFYPDQYYSLNLTEYFINLSPKEAFETFVFLEMVGSTPSGTLMGGVYESYWYEDIIRVNPFRFIRDEISYDNFSEYDNMLKFPRVFEIEKWITLDEISKLDFFNQYYFDQLGASFYINKISGYNPMKSFDATTIELIEVSKKIPFNELIPNAWVDGNNEIYTDGTGDYYTY